MNRTTTLAGAACIALAAWCAPAGAQTGPIRIGLPVPLTGPYGAEAQDQVRNAELAIREFNDAGGLAGRKAELLVRDDKLNPAEAATRALELIEKDHVDFIVGSLSAATQLAVNNVTRQRKVPYISISQSDAINEAADFSRYTFHESLNPHMTTQAVGRYAFRKGMRIAFLTADYAYGQEMTRGFTRVAKEVGATVVGEIRHPLGATDYSPYLPRLMALRPDVVVFNNFGRDNQISIKQAGEFGLKGRTKFVTPVLTYTSRVAAGARVYDGVVGGSSYYWAIESTTPSARALNDRYRRAYNGAVPSDYGSMAYSAVRSLLQAVKAAGTSDTEKVVDALAALRYDTYKGPQSYRACDHQSMQSVLVIQSKAAPQGSPDIFSVLQVAPASADALRSCAELGFK
ncbi:ABC transporter substrate-binding protein [Massilia sp. Root133]|jgi:branched-chain amino acid transport system substrate-binding protein|uniref:ABC transporter substrate-binding protein n=1 Tax=Massilia cellulosiltytica TaxID=2683234 RepID=A0A7X3FZF5_9BURK|nr:MULTISPECIES: ABC transporter substrate-binding protein [Telluria group]KQY15547.1 ABC transporter substrate-binding protein [Massilia sp. Root133]KQZ51061.1 ABC transporter substrate-binding protein [Massilia sp. Root1485]MVW60802.1 ABC transporter substrate-binding protein [Telluria cellulosilytica]